MEIIEDFLGMFFFGSLILFIASLLLISIYALQSD